MTKINLIVLGIIMLFFSTELAESFNDEIAINIKTPKYLIEGIDTEIEFFIVNNGDFIFNGYNIDKTFVSWPLLG